MKTDYELEKLILYLAQESLTCIVAVMLPWLYLKNMIPYANKLPRILSALLVTVFTSFLIIFFIKYLFIREKYFVI
uniref:Uncharacterized protein n=1 Tax=Cyprinus carpio TaxID=7962 RepID=A0A8C1QJF7_CYPCA